MKKQNFFLSLKIQLILFCLIVFLPILYFINNLYQTHIKELLYQETKNKLIHIAHLTAEEFDIKEVISLSKNKDINSKEYKYIKTELTRLKDRIENIKNISIIVKKNNEDAFYLTDINDKSQDTNKDGKVDIGEGLILLDDINYQTKIKAESGLKEGFEKGFVSPVTFTNVEGSWLRGYSPIRNSNVKESAVVAVDMYINNISEKHKKSVSLFRNTIITSFLILLALFLIASAIFLSPIEKIKNKIKNIKKGSFTEDLKSTWLYGEIGELVENVNDMSHELKKYYDKEEINKDEFVEKQKVMELANQQIKSKNYQLNDTIVTLNSINVLVEELISIKDTKELMETVLPSTIKLVNASKGFIIEFLPEENYFQVMTSVNMEKINDGDKITFNDGVYLKKVFETRNYVNVDKISKIKDEGFETALIFPLMVEKEVKGVMYILNKKSEKENEKYFIESDESTVRTLSKLVAAVWESIHLFELASIDSLSKLYVRRYF
ncbi:MAG: GAF domain-containing protein, partial [Candidatus Sericytochromatia bacterium]